ncbi:ATP-binding cassette domain-containing protein [Sulfurimonas sp. HSL-1716]|uniref:ATP-binding cassette domain-containing protein n=1 Tax=Hydrocurvibacter sulfurireducens TaxID=3131937 RepID=UPI0031F801DC
MKVSNLDITYKDKTLVNIDFDINSSLALVGQSGSGKSLTIKALLNMLPQEMKLSLQIKSGFELAAGKTIGFVPQNPFTALSPLTKIKDQIFIPFDEIKELFKQVNLDISLLQRYPPELSGGQLQRVVIAIALSSNPKLLLLDEPTTALDPQTRTTIIDLLKDLQNRFGFKVLFVTHDMSSAQLLCDEICVIKNGKVIESGKMADVLNDPQNIYTKTLIEANFANRKYRE